MIGNRDKAEQQGRCQNCGQPPALAWRAPLLQRLSAGTIEASALVMAAMWLFIAAVAAMDVYCSIKFDYELLTEELNPIGRWLMKMDDGSVSLFMACKFFCNLVALGTLQLLYVVHRPLSLIVAAVLSAMQAGLALLLVH